MTVVTGTVKYGKGRQGTPSKYNANVMRYNILVTLDSPLPDGKTEQRAYFDEGTQPYESLRPGDRVYVTDAGTWKAKLSLIQEDTAAPPKMKQGNETYNQQKKARNKYDVVEVDYSELSKFVRGASAVMSQCILEAKSIRTAVYDVAASSYELMEYDRQLAVTLFIKATEGMQPTADYGTYEPKSVSKELPPDEDLEANDEDTPF